MHAKWWKPLLKQYKILLRVGLQQKEKKHSFKVSPHPKKDHMHVHMEQGNNQIYLRQLAVL